MIANFLSQIQHRCYIGAQVVVEVAVVTTLHLAVDHSVPVLRGVVVRRDCSARLRFAVVVLVGLLVASYHLVLPEESSVAKIVLQVQRLDRS